MLFRSLQADLQNLEHSHEAKTSLLKRLREARAVETDIPEQQKLDLQIKLTRAELLKLEEEIAQIENQIKLLGEKPIQNYEVEACEELAPDEWFAPKKKTGIRRFLSSLFEDT